MSRRSLSRRLLCPDCGEIYDDPDLAECPRDGATLTEFVVDADPDEDPLLGEVLDDRFQIEEVLGEGSMGRVYRATQTSVDRSVAIKTVRPEMATDEETVKRFHREAQAISDFSHPNIVKLVDFGQDLERGTLYLAMEYIDGYPIRELTTYGRLDPGFALHIAMQICGALAEVHSHGLVHRDLKPENLMLVPLADGHIDLKLLDFGIAHVLQQNQNLTETGAVFGTPHFLSPEQAQAKEVGPYSDVYSLGAVLFEMMTGRTPVEAEDPMEVMVGHTEGRIPRLDQVLDPSEVSDHLVWLVENMLSTDPGDRPQDILRVRNVLQTIVKLEAYEPPEVDPSTSPEEMFEPFILPRAGPPSADPVSEPAESSAADETVVDADGPPDRERSDPSSADTNRVEVPPEEAAPPPASGDESTGETETPEPAVPGATDAPGGADGPALGSGPSTDGSSDGSGEYRPTVTGEALEADESSGVVFAFGAVITLALGLAVAGYFTLSGDQTSGQAPATDSETAADDDNESASADESERSR